ncbi:MAG: type III secretion system inner membrane ring subunit SctD [Thiolinea sp.]
MITQQTPFLLKVLSGSNSGALVRLKVGDVVIGRSMSSDIILHDESVAESHLRLKVNQDSIRIEILSSPVLVDNREIEAEEMLLKPFQVVTLGGVDFFIADVRKPGRRSSGDASNVESGTQAAVEKPGAVTPPVVSDVRKKSAQGVAARPAKKKRGGGLKFLLLGLGVLLAANLFYFMPDLLNFAEKVGLRESPVEKAEAVVSTLDIDNLKVEGGHRAAVISGYVDTLEEKRRIMTRVGRIGEGVNYRIWARDELVSNAERVAHALGQTDIGFKALKEGRLAAHGYVSNGEDWERIKVNIMDDVNGIQAIEDDGIQTLLKRKQALEQFIEKKGLSSRIRVTIENNRIKVDGELTQSELNRWSDLYLEFQELHGRGPAIVENLYDAKDRIKLVIRSVSVGDTPFLVSKDGKKYMEGSNLGSNYFIKRITSDHVLLSNDGVEIPIYYGVEDK